MKLGLVIFFLLAVIAQAHAGVALLLEEPYGEYGEMTTTGHAAIYLTHVCASSPTQLRRCEPGEAGVVISRYHKIAGYDWLAIPLIPYLYAVEDIRQIPQTADADEVKYLRDTYRRNYLLKIAPDNRQGRAPRGEWTQLIGASYDRKIYGFEVETSEEQDDALIRAFNARRNKSHFNLLFHNCADFAQMVLNRYYPGAVHRNFIADVGIMSPKQVAKSLVSYSRRHPETELSRFVIPQVAGNIHRSEPVNGVIESLVRTKKYSVPLAVLHPAIAGGLAAAYLTEGRFNPRRNTDIFDISRAIEPPAPSGAPRHELAHSGRDVLPGHSALETSLSVPTQ